MTETAQRELMVQEQPRAQQQATPDQEAPAQVVRHRAAHRQETPEITALTVHHIDRYITEKR